VRACVRVAYQFLSILLYKFLVLVSGNEKMYFQNHLKTTDGSAG
jgi:hypothetical protein